MCPNTDSSGAAFGLPPFDLWQHKLYGWIPPSASMIRASRLPFDVPVCMGGGVVEDEIPFPRVEREWNRMCTSERELRTAALQPGEFNERMSTRFANQECNATFRGL